MQEFNKIIEKFYFNEKIDDERILIKMFLEKLKELKELIGFHTNSLIDSGNSLIPPKLYLNRIGETMSLDFNYIDVIKSKKYTFEELGNINISKHLIIWYVDLFKIKDSFIQDALDVKSSSIELETEMVLLKRIERLTENLNKINYRDTKIINLQIGKNLATEEEYKFKIKHLIPVAKNVALQNSLYFISLVQSAIQELKEINDINFVIKNVKKGNKINHVLYQHIEKFEQGKLRQLEIMINSVQRDVICVESPNSNSENYVRLFISSTKKTLNKNQRRYRYFFEVKSNGEIYQSEIMISTLEKLNKLYKDIASFMSTFVIYNRNTIIYPFLLNYIYYANDSMENMFATQHFLRSKNDRELMRSFMNFILEGKYQYMNSTLDYEWLLLFLCATMNRSIEYNFIHVIFSPRERNSHVNLIEGCLNVYMKTFIPEEMNMTSIRLLVAHIPQILSKDYNLKNIKEKLNKLKSIKPEDFMGTTSSNCVEFISEDTIEFKSTNRPCFIREGRYVSKETYESLMEEFSGNIEDLEDEKISQLIKEIPFIRIFVKNMIGGGRDITINTPGWKFLCAIVESFSQLLSNESKSDLVIQELEKPKIIEKKIFKLKENILKTDRIITITLDGKKWNNHQHLALMSIILENVFNRLYTFAGTFEVKLINYIKSILLAYENKEVMIEVCRYGKYPYALLAEYPEIQNKFILTKSEMKLIQGLLSLKEKNRSKFYKIINHENSEVYSIIKDGFMKIKETDLNKKYKIKTLIFTAKQRTGMGNGIFQCTSSLVGNLIMKKCGPEIAEMLKASKWDSVITSDDMMYFFVMNEKMIERVKEYNILKRINSMFSCYGIELSLAKCSVNLDGRFNFNSTDYCLEPDYDEKALTPLMVGSMKQHSLPRMIKEIVTPQFISPFKIFNNRSTKLMYLFNSLFVENQEANTIIDNLRSVDQDVYMNIFKYRSNESMGYYLFDTLPSVKYRGLYYLTNRKEMDYVMNFTRNTHCKVIYSNLLDINQCANIVDKKDSSIGFRFKMLNLKSILNESRARGIVQSLTNSSANSLMVFTSHLHAIEEKTDNIIQFIKAYRVPFIKTGIYTSNYDFTESPFEHSKYVKEVIDGKWNMSYGYTVDEEHFFGSGKELLKDFIYYSEVISSMEKIESISTFENILIAKSSHRLIDNTIAGKLNSVIGPIVTESYLGEIAFPEKNETLMHYISRKSNPYDPWILSQKKSKWNTWYGYGVLSLAIDGNWYIFVLQDRNILNVLIKNEETISETDQYKIPNILNGYNDMTKISISAKYAALFLLSFTYYYKGKWHIPKDGDERKISATRILPSRRLLKVVPSIIDVHNEEMALLFQKRLATERKAKYLSLIDQLKIAFSDF